MRCRAEVARDLVAELEGECAAYIEQDHACNILSQSFKLGTKPDKASG